MRRWIRLVARLHPPAWRQRYGEEFDAVLEDATADWRQFLDVLRSVLAMQFTHRMSYWRTGGGLALAGALLAMAMSYRVTPRYVSSAVLRLTPVPSADRPVSKEVLRREQDERIDYLRDVSPGSVARVLTANYGAERWQENDEFWKQIRTGIEIRTVAVPGNQSAGLAVSFAGPDKEKARSVVREVVREIEDANAGFDRLRELSWSQLVRLSNSPFPLHEKVDLVEPVSMPTEPSHPRRPLFMVLGAGVGILLGVLALLFWRRPAASFRVAVCGLAGCALGAATSLLFAERYTARAEMRIAAPLDP